MTYKKLISLLYLILVLFCFVIIFLTAKLLFAYHADGYHNGFFINGLSDMMVNYNISTGRWAQGLTNDYRLYTNRALITVINNLLFFCSLYLLIREVFKKYVLIITTVIYFSILYNTFQPSHFRYLIYTLSTSLSYTLGTSLIFLFFTLFFKYRNKKGKENFLAITASSLLLIFITGLVEYLFVFLILLLGYIIFEEVFFSIKSKKWTVSKKSVWYFIVAVIGGLLVVFSPGNISRRARTSDRLENTDFGGSFNFEKFWDSLHEVFLSLMNLNNLILLIFLIVVFSLVKEESEIFSGGNDKKSKSFLLTMFSLGLVFMPITVAFIASNGKVGLPKAYNFTSLAFIFLLIVLAYIVNVLFDLRFKKTVVYPILTIPFLYFTYSYATKGNNLYVQQYQVFSGNLAQVNEEIFARRQYLVETNSVFKEKIIPALSNDYEEMVFNSGTDKGISKHKYYNKVFNNTIPVYIDSSLPKPREFTSIFLAMNKKIKPIYSNNRYNVYYNKKLHTLVLESNNSLFNQPLKSFQIQIITDGGIKKKYRFNLDDEKKQYKSFYSKNDKFTALVLPKDTRSIEIIEFKDCNLNLENNVIKDGIEYNVDYGNLMR